MKKIILSLFAFIMPLLAIAQEGSLDYMGVIPNDPEVRVGTLDNGAKYYIRHNSKDPQRANFHIVYNVGAIQEEDHQNGLAHFLEHMAFNGSKNFPGSMMLDYLRSIGVRFGENLNAGTGRDFTTYMVTNVPITRESIIDSVLLVLHDWAGFISLEEQAIDDERGVILEELRGGKNANERLSDKFAPYMFNNSLYARRNIIGTEEILKTFTYDDIRNFYHKWYRPDMQAFVIVGDVDVDEIEAKLREVMSDIKPFDERPARENIVIEDNEEVLITVETDPELTISQTQLMYRHEPIPMEFNTTIAKFKLDQIMSLIGYMFNERTGDIAMKENAPFTYAGAAYINRFVRPADMFYGIAVGKPEEALKAFEALYTELLRADKGGFVESELERAKTNLLSRAENRYNNRNDRRNQEFVWSYQENFLTNEPIPSVEYEYELTKKVLEDITLAEVNSTIKQLITDKNACVLMSLPESIADRPTIEDIKNLMKSIKESDIEIFEDEIVTEPLIDVESLKPGKVIKEEEGKFGSSVWTLENGIKVVLKHTDFKADEVLMTGRKKGGTSLISDLDDYLSISSYSDVLYNSGIANFTQSQLDRLLTGKVASATPFIGDANVGINGNAAPKDIETMLQLAHLYITAPRFDQGYFNVFINQAKSVIPHLVETPNYKFQKELSKYMYGDDPRASVPSLEILEKVSLERMERVYKELFGDAAGMTFIFTGNFDMDAMKPLVEKYLGSLPVSKIDAQPKYGENFITPFKGIVDHTFETVMENPKATVFTVYNGDINWTLKEKINMDAIGHILGIRYTQVIREEMGGTYGVAASMNELRTPNPSYILVVTFDTEDAKVEGLVPVIQAEIDYMMENGVSEENLKIFKEYAVKKFNENNISNHVWRSYLNEWYQWGDDNYTDYIKGIEELSIDSIKETAKRLFSQGNVLKLIQMPADKQIEE